MSNFLNQLFIQTAFAQDAAPAPAGPSLFENMLVPIGFLVILYFFVLRPQIRKQKEHNRIMSELKVGDEVLTQSGLIGKIRSIADQFVTLELSQGASAKMLKSSILQTTQSMLAANKAATKETKTPQKA